MRPDPSDLDLSRVLTVQREVEAPAEAVWTTLADGWLYATWVVGASRVRDVDPGWPSQGSRIHHSSGIWPVLISDTTEVLRVVAPTELVLRARGWPVGVADVIITVEGLTAATCRVSISEDAVRGPAALVPRPVRQLAFGPRNVEVLRRLAYLAEGRHRERLTAP